MASEQGSAVQTTETAQESSETVQAILFDMVSSHINGTGLSCPLMVQWLPMPRTTCRICKEERQQTSSIVTCWGLPCDVCP